MDWTLAITRNREALLRVIAALYAYAGLANGAAFVTLPRHIYRALLRVLRPAESAVRRLIIIAAHGLVMRRGDRLLNSANALTTKPRWWEKLSKLSPKLPAFPLIDPLKRFAPFDRNAPVGLEFVDWDEEEDEADTGDVIASYPRISTPGFIDRVPIVLVVPIVDDTINAAPISRRLLALTRALSNLTAQARRLVRWQMRRDLALQTLPYKPRRLSPFRPGSPPGARLKRRHEVDHILRECHALVFDRMADSS